MNNRGFTLVELVLSLAVIAILILAITTGAGVRENARIQAAAESVRTLRTAAENYIAEGNMTFTNIDMAGLISSNYLPGGFIATGSNPWAGDYTITANASDSGQVDIGLTAVPTAAGTRLSSLFANSADTTSYAEATSTWTGTF